MGAKGSSERNSGKEAAPPLPPRPSAPPSARTEEADPLEALRAQAKARRAEREREATLPESKDGPVLTEAIPDPGNVRRPSESVEELLAVPGGGFEPRPWAF